MDGPQATFFGSEDKGTYTANEVITLMDGNQKGPGENDEKFHSLVFSPSAEEAAQLGSARNAL